MTQQSVWNRRPGAWWPKRCFVCGRWHLNGRHVQLPHCPPCWDDYLREEPVVVQCACGVVTGGHRAYRPECPMHGTSNPAWQHTTYGGAA